MIFLLSHIRQCSKQIMSNAEEEFYTFSLGGGGGGGI